MAGLLLMPRMFTNVFSNSGRQRPMASGLRLIDRGEYCPAFMNLTGLTEDPDLRHYIRAQVRQLKADFHDDAIFPDSNSNQECTCSSAGISHWRLAKKIKANRDGWQNELAQSLLPYIMSHLSANIVSNIHEVLIVDGPLNWKEFAPCVVRQNRNNPAFVLEAAGRAIQARFKLQKAAIQKCAIMGAFLNVIKRHWLRCEWFRGGHEGCFPEHEYLRHELFLEAMSSYNEQPNPEMLELCSNELGWSLAALSCPLSFEHPEIHRIEFGPAVEHLQDDKASQDDNASQSSHNSDKGRVSEVKGICGFPGCETETSSSRREDAGS